MAGASAGSKVSGSVAALLAAATHDLRQPLQGLKLLTGVVANEADAARRLQSTLRMNISIGSLFAMLELLGAIAKLEHEGLAARSAPIVLDDLLSAVVAEINPVVAGRGSTVTAATSGLIVQSDRPVLHECVKGLVLNALWVDAASQLNLSARPGVGQAVIEVAVDRPVAPTTGPGRVFVEISYSSGGQPALATGLGLRAVELVAGLLGLALESQPASGGGTTFTLKPV